MFEPMPAKKVVDMVEGALAAGLLGMVLGYHMKGVVGAFVGFWAGVLVGAASSDDLRNS